MAEKLTVARVLNAAPGVSKKTGEPIGKLYGDDLTPTLFLYVAPGGSKSWVQRLTIDGKRVDMGLGSVALVSLKEARDKAHDNRKIARNGGDPRTKKRKVPIFRDAAALVFEAKAPALSERSRKEWLVPVTRYAEPIIGDKRLDKIGREAVLRVLTPIWTTKPEIARKLRQRLVAVFKWGMAHGHCETNPAGEGIDGALPAMPSVKKNNEALPHVEIADALKAVDRTKASQAVQGAIRFLILSACRSGEVRGARWDEIDRDAGVWKIPADRMKARREHRVPLTPAMVAVLDTMEARRDGSGLIFPSPAKRGAALSAPGLVKALTEAGYPRERTTLHGFRTSFRTWCADTNKARELAEAALAHTVKGVEGDYQRSDMLERRRDLMAAWSDYATGKSAAVHRLRAG